MAKGNRQRFHINKHNKKTSHNKLCILQNKNKGFPIVDTLAQLIKNKKEDLYSTISSTSYFGIYHLPQW
jgi:hypothetical protein